MLVQRSFRKAITSWLSAAPKGDANNFFKTLTPNSLSSILQLPLPDTTYYNHNTSLHKALKSRRKPLQKALGKIREWFINNPIPHGHLQKTSPNNPWFISNSCFSSASPIPIKLTFPKQKPTTQPINKHPYKRRPATKMTKASKFFCLPQCTLKKG